MRVKLEERRKKEKGYTISSLLGLMRGILYFMKYSIPINKKTSFSCLGIGNWNEELNAISFKKHISNIYNILLEKTHVILAIYAIYCVLKWL